MICDTHACVAHRRMCRRAYCTIQRRPGAFGVERLLLRLQPR